jgi:hypothetical protein
MADNFDMKKFLVENKLGAYSRLKTEGEAAYEYEKGKEAGEKLAKEDMGKDLEDTKAAGMMDFLAEEEPLKEDASAFAEILGTLAGVAGIGLTALQIFKAQNALEKSNPELHKQLQNISSTISAADPSKNLEENEDGGQGIENDIEQDLMYAEDPILYLKSIIDFCNKKIEEIGQDGDEIEEAKKEEGYMGTQYDSSEDMAVDMIKKGITEKLTPEAFERMDALTSTRAQIAMIKAAEIMMNELTEEGFEVLDIREYFTQLIANDI